MHSSFVRIQLLVLLLLLPTSYTFAELQFLWLQGVYADRTFPVWNAYVQHASHLQSKIVMYNQRSSIEAMAMAIFEEHLQPNHTNTNYIIVAHGVGGLVARSLSLMSPSVKGIVLINTPHNGVSYLYHYHKGSSNSGFDTAIRKTKTAINGSKVAQIERSTSLAALGVFIEAAGKNVQQHAVDQTLQELKTMYSQMCFFGKKGHWSLPDLLPDSEYIQRLRKSEQTVPVINVYTYETHWPTLKSVIAFYNTKVCGNSNQALSPAANVHFRGYVRTLAMLSHMQQLLQISWNLMSLPAVVTPSLWTAGDQLYEARLEWARANRYLKEGIHRNFAENLGAVHYRLQSFSVPVYGNTNTPFNYRNYLPVITDNNGLLSWCDVVLHHSNKHNRILNIPVKGMSHFSLMLPKNMNEIVGLILAQKRFESTEKHEWISTE